MPEVLIRFDPATGRIQLNSNLGDTAHVLLLLERARVQLLANPSPGLDGPRGGLEVPPADLARKLTGG